MVVELAVAYLIAIRTGTDLDFVDWIREPVASLEYTRRASVGHNKHNDNNKQVNECNRASNNNRVARNVHCTRIN